MLSATLSKALNQQIGVELESAFTYLSMSAYSAHQSLKGIAHWFSIQYREELKHAEKIMGYLIDRGARVHLTALPKVASDFDSPAELFEKALKQERHVSQCIHRMVDQAVKEKDHATQNFLQWFVAEQVEEEATAQEVLDRIRLAGPDKRGLLILDSQLAQRKAED